MTFTSTITRRVNFWGHKRVVYGTFTSDTTGGDIDTSLRTVEYIELQHTGAAAVADAPSVIQDLPCNGRAITIVTTSAKNGLWKAIGL
jgi:hypothetical protein